MATSLDTTPVALKQRSQGTGGGQRSQGTGRELCSSKQAMMIHVSCSERLLPGNQEVRKSSCHSIHMVSD